MFSFLFLASICQELCVCYSFWSPSSRSLWPALPAPGWDFLCTVEEEKQLCWCTPVTCSLSPTANTSHTPQGANYCPISQGINIYSETLRPSLVSTEGSLACYAAVLPVFITWTWPTNAALHRIGTVWEMHQWANYMWWRKVYPTEQELFWG